MQGSKQAITRLKKTIEENYSYSKPSKESIVFLIQETRELIDRVHALDKNDEKSNQIAFLTAAVPVFVTACIDANKQGKLDAFLRNLTYLREAVNFTYLYLTQDPIRSELELSQLANDIEQLRGQKDELTETIGDLKKVISFKKYLEQSTVDSAQLMSDVQEKISELTVISDKINSTEKNIDDAYDTAKGLFENIEELYQTSINLSEKIREEYTSVEDAKEQELAFTDTLEKLHKQSRLVMKEINEVLGDANRTSMAASFKTKEDELARKVAGYDFLNYATLAAIALTAFLITVNPSFFNIPALSLQSFYERVLIFIPLGIISWFSSRKSHQLFQLKEEYAYKYASAVAFEGYKRQAENNEVMQEELLKIAIENLGKNPTAIFDKKLSHTPVEKVVDGVVDGVTGALKNN